MLFFLTEVRKMRLKEEARLDKTYWFLRLLVARSVGYTV